MSTNADTYGPDSILVLDGLEAVRRRPGMYVGDVNDGSGQHHMLVSLVERARDEHVAGGKASRVRVSIEGPLAEVEDDGEGLPIEIDPRSGMRVAELLVTKLHCPGPADLAIANALSSRLELEVRRGGYAWRQTYAKGRPLGPMDRFERTEKTGTRIQLHADPTIFKADFDRTKMRERLLELAAFNPAMTFALMAETIAEPLGVAGWLARTRRGPCTCGAGCEEETFSEIFATRGRRGDVEVDVAIAWSDFPCHEVISSVDQRRTSSGGTHERGLWRGLVAAISQRGPGPGGAPRLERARQRLPGLRAIIDVRVPRPLLEGCLRERLGNAEADLAVCAVVAEAYGAFLDARPKLARTLVKALRRER